MNKRSVYFLLPVTAGKWSMCGGVLTILNLYNIAKEICDASIATYHDREKGIAFLDDVLKATAPGEAVFFICWGPHIPFLLHKLRGQRIVYYAHSWGWKFSLPVDIPIVAVSRYIMARWAEKNPSAPVYYLPNLVHDDFCNQGAKRDIDVLCISRKSSPYLKDILLPELRRYCNVYLLNTFVPRNDLVQLFNRSKVYLYDSHDYCLAKGKCAEGFGLQPLEALACGCTVFSNLDGGLSNYLDPALNCHKIRVYSTEYDIQRIIKAVNAPLGAGISEEQLREYRKPELLRRFKVIMEELNEFFEFRHSHIIKNEGGLQLLFNQFICSIKGLLQYR